MSKFIQTVLWLSLFFLSACVGSQEKLHPQVNSYIQLLVRPEEPTIAELEKFTGECGGEFELDFVLDECRSKGWHIHSQSCINFSRQQCNMTDQKVSLAFSWLRERFSTVGKNYRLIGVRSEHIGQNGYTYDLVEVEIGENKFLFFHNPNIDISTPEDVYVIEVNGKDITDLRQLEKDHPLGGSGHKRGQISP